MVVDRYRKALVRVGAAETESCVAAGTNSTHLAQGGEVIYQGSMSCCGVSTESCAAAGQTITAPA